MKFSYKARTKEGKIETGTVEASSKEAAVLLLQKYDIFVTSMTAIGEKKPFLINARIERKISRKDLAVFSRQLAVMLDSRVPVIQSLNGLALQANKENFKKVILEISRFVEEGVPLSEALGHFPQIFDNFFVNLVKSGEISGNISEALYYIADHLEREQEIVSQLQQAMVYPIFTLSVLFVVLNIIIIFLLPKIEELIRESSANPPPFTQIMLGFYHFLGNFWWMMMLAFLIGVVAVVFYFKTKNGKKVYDRLSLKIPFLGDILRKIFLSRFCGNVSTLMTAGISINRALKITSDTVNNSVYKEIINEIERKVSEGEKISSLLMQRSDYFPPFVVQMIKVGEETGKLDKTLMEVVNFYQKEVKRAIDLFLTLLEPMLIIFLGLIVGVIAISVFAPLYGALGTV
ncbi:MAG: hypothetical protein A3D44_01735 [Candidatus Staskawiczbacteria bacterium RIFCSPHIGHO2_02_FULL_42_22]|uniref:Type II secretion system protein GspF domain-containing protein n=1 Tax=Candidatus Staskawiczbacteria bacterium RIFCSPHIGHO2_02_FULL_42_22 TaxID=1802207 RepID=A0A1G2I1R8_9BACT|nr:MAG: hypothetical protein A3D44_01735 [Candidatus Staskawiczbacteria bacterium RIFCSPHIGHO2_02_FULL_42_22]